MSIWDRLGGLVAALAYALQRAKIGFLRLRAGTVLACAVAAAYATYRGWRGGLMWWHQAIIVLCLFLAGLLLWAHQRHYIVFRQGGPRATDAAADLHPEEKVRVRASGVFEVSGMARYLVEVPGMFWTTLLAEHIVAAQVRGLNLLGVGVPAEERGWWYAFVEPGQVLNVAPGELCFGLRLRPAVRIVCGGSRTNQTLYLSCDSAEQQARLLKELETKARAARERTM